jgi:serine/threonine protein kinase
LLHKKAGLIALSWSQKLSMALQMAKGMLALHSMNPPIIHRDLKSLNVFVIDKQGEFIAKVADFGLSRSPESEMMTMYLGTLVLSVLLSIGWLPSCLITGSTQVEWMYTPLPSCCGKSVHERRLTTSFRIQWP